MPASAYVRVQVNLLQIQQNAGEIARATGVAVIAVVKADAYGLGAARVTEALADLVERFCVFGLSEAVQLDLWNRTGKVSLAIGPLTSADPGDYLSRHVQPAVSSPGLAKLLQKAHPVVCVDTGQQRFACPVDQVALALEQEGADEAFTHAATLEQVRVLQQAAGKAGVRLHAAGSSLLHEPAAWLDAVRPGLALYQGAARVSTTLIESRKNIGPAGYSGFVVPFHGVIPAGYSHGLCAGPCLVGGRMSRILEVGMQTAFVETGPDERAGDEVVLLGEGLTEQRIAQEWKTSPHECLVRLANCGMKEYVGG
jgi:alanine racemase